MTISGDGHINQKAKILNKINTHYRLILLLLDYVIIIN